MIDIRKVSYFLRLAETLNFNAAATELHISHQALSRIIQSLEDEVGEKLFERSTKKVVLTEIGKTAYDLYTPLLKEWNHAEEQVRAVVEARKHILRFGYYSGLSYEKIIEPIQKFLLDLTPDLRIHMVGADMPVLREFLEKDSVDLVVTHGIHHGEWGDNEIIDLRTDPLRIIVSKKHPWYQRKSITEDDLKESVMLVYDDGRPKYGAGAFFEELPAADREAVYNLDSYVAMLNLGNYSGIVGSSFSRRENNYKLLPLPAPYQKEHTIMAMYKKQHPQRKSFQKLKDLQLKYDI